MKRIALFAALCGLCTGANRDDAPPPAVQQNGVVNAASEMPAEFSGGSIAPGSLLRIHAWRLGLTQMVRAPGYPLPETLAGLRVEIRQGDRTAAAAFVSAGANEIEAILPSTVPVGDAELVIVREGSRSEPFHFRVVPASFGAFYAPGPRRGQGLIRNGAGADDGVWNDPDHSAEPGELVSLLGTGLGATPGSDTAPPQRLPVAVSSLQVTVGGVPVRRVVYAGRSGTKSGMDELVFEVPRNAPEGCHVPVQVRSESAASNFVSLAVRKAGGRCSDPGDWIRSASEQVRTAAVIVLNHTDLVLRMADGSSARFRVDTSFAKFVANPPVHGSTDRWLSFPPPGTCTAQERFTHLRAMMTTLSPLDLIEGTPLDAGEQLTFRGAGGTRRIGKPQGSEKTYGGVLGGNSPVPSANNLPLFLRPGDYAISGEGADTGPFTATVHALRSIRWKDRDAIASVDRSKGVTVHWAAARPDDFVLIAAVNTDNETGALGRALCVAPAQQGSFTIPAAALTNLPPTIPGPGLPLNTLWVLEVPGHSPPPFRSQRLDRGLAFYVSASGRTVSFR